MIILHIKKTSPNDCFIIHFNSLYQRKVLWFNPPYSMNVKTTIAKKFLQLLDKRIPANHHLHKVFNRNNVKVSYSCMPNTSNAIKAHNKRILQDQHNITTEECNCRIKETCPLKGECLTENIVYLATVSNSKSNEEKSYIGLTERSFKDRLYKHRNSLRHRSKANATELSKYVWELRDRNIEEINIKWSNLDKGPTYISVGSKTCSLCLSEKFHKIFHNEGNLPHKRSEILSTCRHRNKFLLSWRHSHPPGPTHLFLIKQLYTATGHDNIISGVCPLYLCMLKCVYRLIVQKIPTWINITSYKKFMPRVWGRESKTF